MDIRYYNIVWVQTLNSVVIDNNSRIYFKLNWINYNKTDNNTIWITTYSIK